MSPKNTGTLSGKLGLRIRKIRSDTKLAISGDFTAYAVILKHIFNPAKEAPKNQELSFNTVRNRVFGILPKSFKKLLHSTQK